jgi:hypothetical protein
VRLDHVGAVDLAEVGHLEHGVVSFLLNSTWSVGLVGEAAARDPCRRRRGEAPRVDGSGPPINR